MAKVIFAEDHSKLETIKVDLREMVQFLREEKSLSARRPPGEAILWDLQGSPCSGKSSL